MAKSDSAQSPLWSGYPPSDPLREKLAKRLTASFDEKADLADARRVAKAALEALRKPGADADSVSGAAVAAVGAEVRRAEQAVTAAERRLRGGS